MVSSNSCNIHGYWVWGNLKNQRWWLQHSKWDYGNTKEHSWISLVCCAQWCPIENMGLFGIQSRIPHHLPVACSMVDIYIFLNQRTRRKWHHVWSNAPQPTRLATRYNPTSYERGQQCQHPDLWTKPKRDLQWQCCGSHMVMFICLNLNYNTASKLNNSFTRKCYKVGRPVGTSCILIEWATIRALWIRVCPKMEQPMAIKIWDTNHFEYLDVI